jgi:hypothetical protein
MAGLGCAVIFASKRNEGKRKRNFILLGCKKSVFSLVSHRCETWKHKAKRKWNDVKTKQKRSEKLPSFLLQSEMKQKTSIIFASKLNEAKQKQKTSIIFALK